MKSSHRPFSPALMALSGVVAGLCFVVLAYAFVRDMSPRQIVRQGVFNAQAERGLMNVDPGETQPDLVPIPEEDRSIVLPTTTREFAEDAYQQSPFRVIKVIKSPDKLYSYVIVTPRAEYGRENTETGFRTKLVNDTVCGSHYTQPVCYLFREGNNYNGVNPVPTLMTAWSGGGFSEDTAVKYIKRGEGYLMQFTTVDGDAGCSSTFSHQIDLTTSEYSLLKRTDSCSN